MTSFIPRFCQATLRRLKQRQKGGERVREKGIVGKEKGTMEKEKAGKGQLPRRGPLI